MGRDIHAALAGQMQGPFDETLIFFSPDVLLRLDAPVLFEVLQVLS